MPAAPTSSTELLDLLRKSGIVPPERLSAAFPDPAEVPAEPAKVAAALVQQGLITRFQAQQLLAGRHKGFRLGAYAIQDQLGRGGMGAVYLAQHLELRRNVAIKVLVAGKEEDQKLAIERFLREARAAAALDHPNIVRIFDVCRHGDVPYLVMEYVEGETLQQVLDRDGVIPYTTATEFVAQSAAGLQHAHEKGFVHRDIKPSNLILDRTGTVKILDMGLARSNTSDQDKLTERLDAGAVVGTADFIAPEQALNTPRIDIRADIYSLGATYFALITGKPPFEGNTAQKLLQHQVTAAPHLSTIDATLPKGLAGVVAKMLAKKPNDRYQTPAELIAALAPWLGNSAKILAGLSRTNLAQGVDLHATLNDLAMRSSASGRLGVSSGVTTGPDSGEINPGAPVKETGAVASAETTRNPAEKPRKPKGGKATKTLKPVKAAKAKSGIPPWVTLVTLGVVLLVGASVAYVAFMRKTDESKSLSDSGPDVVGGSGVGIDPGKNPGGSNKNPQPGGKDNSSKALTPVSDKETVRVQLDLSKQQQFYIRSTVVVPAENPSRKDYMELSNSGPGKPPTGWSARCYNPVTQMEFFADPAPNGALGIRNVKGSVGSAMMFTPRFDCESKICRIRLEYSTNVRAGRFVLRFKPTKPDKAAWDVTKPAVIGLVWRTEELVVDLQGATQGFFEFHNTDENPEAAVRVRTVLVTELPVAGQPQNSNPGAAAPDFSRHVEGAVVYRLDVAAITPFRVTKGGSQPTQGEPEMLPPGITCRCWKATARGEFRREERDGSAALGLTNFSDEKSAQFAFELEKELNLFLKPGKAYRVKVDYLTKADADGALVVQTQDYKGVAWAKLANTGGQWKSATASFERKEGIPVRLTIDNDAVGEGNTLYFRSVELVELNPPQK
jgi:hypothetical protein